MIVGPETHPATTEDQETQDHNLRRDPPISRHLHQCVKRKHLADNRSIPIHSLHGRPLVPNLRKWRDERSPHQLDLQQAEVDEVVAMMRRPSLMLAIFSSLQPVLEEPSIRKCKIRTMDA